MPVLSGEKLKKMPEPLAINVIPRHVARYLDLMGLAGKSPIKVIGEDAVLPDKPGFEVDFVTRGSFHNEVLTFKHSIVLMPMRGHWFLRWENETVTLNPGDTCILPAGFSHILEPSMAGEASMYRVISNDDPAGPTWTNI